MSLIDELKEIDIVQFLTSRGHPIKKESNTKVWFCSPARNEQEPSFCVFKALNKFKDYGSNEPMGDIIDLVSLLNSCDTKTAMETLKNDGSVVSFEPVEISQEPLISVTKTLDRFISPNLIMYLRSRGISEKTYNKYTKETYYSFKDTPEKIYHAVGLLNDSGGYELRNSFQKYAVSPKDSTTYLSGSNSCSIFEGMFDFLSAVEYFGDLLFQTDVYVLNGLGILYRHLDRISRYGIVNIYLDEGIGASNSIDLIRSRMYDGLVKDHRYMFEDKKDFNEFWVNLNKK